jgi:hypothetical protein
LAAILNTIANCDCKAGFTVERALFLKKGKIVFDVLAAEAVKSTVFWVVLRCNSKRDQCFVGNYHLHLQGGVNEERNQYKKTVCS